jgi:uncharacterized membrane-anchored protein
MARQFKLIVLMGVAAFIVCGVAVFYTHRTAHGTTAEEQAAYESGEKAGKEALSSATLPTEAELNVMAQKYFKQQGPAEQHQNPSRAADLQGFKQAFEKGYTAGFKKTHPQK